MKLAYGIKILEPHTHYMHVTIDITQINNTESLDFFLPSWSPGSYLMREYGKNIRKFKAIQTSGEHLEFKQVDKGVYRVDLDGYKEDSMTLTYDVYCHELTVRTSFIDNTHAFIHGPSVFMGVLNHEVQGPTLKIEFPALWSKLSTGLKDISTKREVFLYSANNYDELIDSPIEIGCQETDGFMVEGVEHHLCYYGQMVPHKHDLKADIKKLVETVVKVFGDIPFDNYTFMTHFVPGLFGGLEHLNSTALQFDSFGMNSKKGYTQWLELVVHEYFHSWNVKRIRPIELGPFNYLEEAKTSMHWLTEGLTSFMDQLFVLRSGLINLDEYLEMMVANINRYESIPGRHFDSLEASSFNAWIKLYRPDENSTNSSVSYYLKGGLVFFVLNVLFHEKGKNIDDLLKLLWADYKKNPERGLISSQVYDMVEEVAGPQIKNEFITMITTTEDIDFEKFLNRINIDVEYENEKAPYLGAQLEYSQNNVIIKSVVLDGPSYKSGLNAGDEIIAVDKMRAKKAHLSDLKKWSNIDHRYTFTVARKGILQDIDVLMGVTPRKVKKLTSNDNCKTLLSLVP